MYLGAEVKPSACKVAYLCPMQNTLSRIFSRHASRALSKRLLEPFGESHLCCPARYEPQLSRCPMLPCTTEYSID